MSADKNVVTKLGVNRHNRYIAALLSVNDVTLAFVSLLSLREAPRAPDEEEEEEEEEEDIKG